MLKDENEFVKKIEIPFSNKELDSQHSFINYLKANNIKTAKIKRKYDQNGFNYEVQEKIHNDNYFVKTENLIETIAIFHKISKQYSFDIKKKDYYNYEFDVRGVRLNTVLLGYKEKFHDYPLNSLQKNICNVKFYNKKIINFITKYYNNSFYYLTSKYGIKSCIIHNDISKNNVISCNNELFLIDFDFCIRSLEVVDIADAIMIEYSDLDMIMKNIESFKKNIDIYCSKYNKINSIGITPSDIIYQIIVKLISFYYYVIINCDDKKIFNKNIRKVYKIIKKVG